MSDKTPKEQERWIDDVEAMQLLKIKSKKTLQKFKRRRTDPLLSTYTKNHFVL